MWAGETACRQSAWSTCVRAGAQLSNNPKKPNGYGSLCSASAGGWTGSLASAGLPD